MAHHLLRINDIETLDRVASRLRQYIGKECAKELVTRLLPFCWVDTRVATNLAKRVRSAPPYAPLAMYTIHVETPQMYIKKASGQIEGWRIVMYPKDWSHEDRADCIINKVRSEVACQLLGFMPNDNYTEEDFEDELAKFFKNEDVSVILFPPPFSKLDKELLTPVISDSLLARLVLFLRCDQPAEPLLSPKLQKVAFLDRPDEALERRAMLINNRFTRS